MAKMLKHWSQTILPAYTMDMLVDDINGGKVELVLERFNSTLETNIHASNDRSIARLSEAIRRHPPRYT